MLQRERARGWLLHRLSARNDKSCWQPLLVPGKRQDRGNGAGKPALGATDSEIAGDLMKNSLGVEFPTMQNQQ